MGGVPRPHVGRLGDGLVRLGSVLLAGAEKDEIAAFAQLWRRCTSAEMAVGLQDAAAQQCAR